MKKDEEDDASKKNGVANGKAANGQSNGKAGNLPAGKEGRGVGKMISNIMTNASAACYIGQNGLYQTNGKSKGNDFCKGQETNGKSSGRGQTNGYSGIEKKNL